MLTSQHLHDTLPFVELSTLQRRISILGRYELLSLSISSMYHDIQKIERVEMARFGLKGPHAQCLLMLCEISDKDKAAISRAISELEEAGMILRQDRNGNRYRAPVKLTAQGILAAQSVAQRAKLAVEQAGMGLEEDQRQIFYQVLSLIAGNLHTICKDGLSK